MDKRIKKKLEILNKKLQKLRKQLSGARQQNDEPGEVERLEQELQQVTAEVERFKKA